MADEKLERQLNAFGASVGRTAEQNLRAHIAALEAEIERLHQLGEMHHGAALEMERERDAFRERVKALEAEASEVDAMLCPALGVQSGPSVQRVGCARALVEKLTRTREELAAMRQRAGDTRELIAAWNAGAAKSMVEGMLSVARYILGPDTTEEVPHGDDAPEEAEDPIDAAPEPTIAKAFATVWEGVRHIVASPAHDNAHSRASFALSVLERHMGALARALSVDNVANKDEYAKARAWEAACAVLSDAPAVFTLEEVQAEVGKAVDAARDAILAALRGTGGGR